ncbi:hypothetical protein ABEW20_07280 [Bacillus safensis]
MTWILDGKIQNQIPDFDINHLKQINEIHYFKEYNEYDDLINFLLLHIPYESSIELNGASLSTYLLLMFPHPNIERCNDIESNLEMALICGVHRWIIGMRILCVPFQPA